MAEYDDGLRGDSGPSEQDLAGAMQHSDGVLTATQLLEKLRSMKGGLTWMMRTSSDVLGSCQVYATTHGLFIVPRQNMVLAVQRHYVRHMVWPALGLPDTQPRFSEIFGEMRRYDAGQYERELKLGSPDLWGALRTISSSSWPYLTYEFQAICPFHAEYFGTRVRVDLSTTRLEFLLPQAAYDCIVAPIKQRWRDLLR